MAGNKIVLSEDSLAQKFTDEQKELKKTTFKNMVKLLKEKKFSEMLSIAESPLKILPNEALGEGDNEMSEIYFLFASAYKEIGADIDTIRKNAIKSFHFNRLNKNSLWLIRELDNILSPETKLFRLQIIGKIYRMYKTEEVKDVFRTIYTVAAEDENKALEYIKKYDRPETVQELEILKTYDLGLRADLPQGIYETMKMMQWVDGEE